MPRITMTEAEEFKTLPADSILLLKVDETRVKTVQGQRGDWEKLEFTFKILGIQSTGDGSPVEDYDMLTGSKIWGSCSFRFTDNPENKLKLWVEAILGMELTAGFELDTDLLDGRSVRGVTSVYEKKAVNPATGLPFIGHQIASLLPAGTGGVAAAPSDPWGAAAPSAPAAGASNLWDDDMPPF